MKSDGKTEILGAFKGIYGESVVKNTEIEVGSKNTLNTDNSSEPKIITLSCLIPDEDDEDSDERTPKTDKLSAKERYLQRKAKQNTPNPS